MRTLKNISVGVDAHTLLFFTCSKGSVVVNYELAVKKTAAAETLNTIVETVKKAVSDDSFGNFTVDPTSIKATSECTFFLFTNAGCFAQMFLALLNIVNLIFTAVEFYTVICSIC